MIFDNADGQKFVFQLFNIFRILVKMKWEGGPIHWKYHLNVGAFEQNFAFEQRKL